MSLRCWFTYEFPVLPTLPKAYWTAAENLPVAEPILRDRQQCQKISGHPGPHMVWSPDEQKVEVP